MQKRRRRLDLNMALSQESDNTCGIMVVSTKENEPSSCSSYSAKTILNSVTAGYAAGSFGVLVGQPMDTAKVWLQTKGATPVVSPEVPTTTSSAVANNVSTGLMRPSSSSSSLTTTSSSAANNMSTLTVPQERGFNLRSIRALYSGVSGPLMTVGMIQSINFAIYDSLRRVLHRRTHPDAPDSAYLNTDSLAHVTVSAMVAGGVLACFTSPLLVIKTKQQVMEWNFQKAFLDTVRSSKKSILSSFYVGFGPHCVAEVCGRGIYFYSYETLKRLFLENRQGGGEARTTMTVSLPERCVSAALSGILCWSIIFPFDALRSRMYAQALSSSLTAKSSWEMAKSMYREQQSLRPFYRGFAVTVLRAGPVAATVLPIYDTTLEWLSRDE